MLLDHGFLLMYILHSLAKFDQQPEKESCINCNLDIIHNLASPSYQHLKGKALKTQFTIHKHLSFMRQEKK